MLQPLYHVSIANMSRQNHFFFYAIFSILMHTLNSSHGHFPSMKSQIHREKAQFIGQRTENSSSSSSSSGRINSNTIVLLFKKIKQNQNKLFLNIMYFTSLRY